MRYKTRRISKLYAGCADLRDYEVANALKSESALRIVFKDEYMTLTPTQLREEGIHYGRDIQSRLTPGQTYKLIGYKWNPDYVEKLPLEEEIKKHDEPLSFREAVMANPPPQGFFEKIRGILK